MKNLIVLGDSFSSNAQGWPSIVANQLNLNLICYGEGGQSWWSSKHFLNSVSGTDIENCEAVIFAHTNSDRVPTSNKTIGKINHSQLNKNNEIELAVALYFKYIHDSEFVHWAHKKWFEEISVRWAHTKIVNLHCFPWTWDSRTVLSGVNVWPSLSSISLNEVDAKEFSLIHDQRSNHLNTHNNQELANQVVDMINNYTPGDARLDLTKFQHLTDKWTHWK
jgi:hypothetical protein